jgi:hypothetical protein
MRFGQSLVLIGENIVPDTVCPRRARECDAQRCLKAHATQPFNAGFSEERCRRPTMSSCLETKRLLGSNTEPRLGLPMRAEVACAPVRRQSGRPDGWLSDPHRYALRPVAPTAPAATEYLYCRNAPGPMPAPRESRQTGRHREQASGRSASNTSQIACPVSSGCLA